jgi:hypothetical protein
VRQSNTVTKEKQMTRTINRSARPSTTIALALLGLAMLAASPARAHEDPPGCNETGASINVAIFRDAAATIPLTGAVSPCEIVYYRAVLTKAQPQQAGDTVCAFSGGQFDFRTPNGNLTVASANVPCIGATVGSAAESCVAGVNAIATPIIQYTVNPADVNNGLISALSTYGFAGGVTGVAHDGVTNTPGVQQATPKQTAVLSCDDQNACTTDVCDMPLEHGAAGCSHNAISCDDSNACTADGCDPASGCFHTDISGQCDDNSACTTDTCNPATGCVHTPVDCNDGSACTNDGCDPATGCTHSQVDCNDGNACTQDGCNPATGCTHTDISSSCNDGNACTNDSCNPATGCVHTAVDCNDSNACTADSCNPATGCVHTDTSSQCDDGNACTNDSCNPASGCVHTDNSSSCNDNNACTNDGCNPATGCTHSAVNCDDSNACTADACDAATGCTHTAISCNDSNACTDDSCNPASGCVHTDNSSSCNDSNACTNDGCSPATGCTHTAVVCNDGSACTNDSCNPATGCVHTQVNCDDSSACTQDGCNAATGCTHQQINCNDSNACTNDDCSPATGCTHTDNSSGCNDTNLCTTDSCNPATGCVHTPISCDDGNICTDDSCNPQSGCVHTFDSSNDASCQPVTCRTPGFWGTHGAVSQAALNHVGGCVEVCGEVIKNVTVASADSVLEAICVSPQGNQKLQLARQLTSAALNCAMSDVGGDCSGNSELDELFSDCNNACQGLSSTRSVGDCIEQVDAFNNGNFENETGCHDRALPAFLPKGAADTPQACNAARKNSCTVIPPGEKSTLGFCTAGGTISANPETCQ